QTADEARELRGVRREHAGDRSVDVAQLDQVVAVDLQEVLRGTGERGEAGQQVVQLPGARLERGRGGDRVAQDVRHLRQDVRIRVGHSRELRDVVQGRRDLRVQLLQVGVQGRDGVAQLGAAALESVRDGRQGGVEVLRVDRRQQRVQVGQDCLDLGRDL